MGPEALEGQVSHKVRPTQRFQYQFPWFFRGRFSATQITSQRLRERILFCEKRPFFCVCRKKESHNASANHARNMYKLRDQQSFKHTTSRTRSLANTSTNSHVDQNYKTECMRCHWSLKWNEIQNFLADCTRKAVSAAHSQCKMHLTRTEIPSEREKACLTVISSSSRTEFLRVP